MHNVKQCALARTYDTYIPSNALVYTARVVGTLNE
jgi:hypothetical protein